jgi:SAM-dependent methyltransferase
MNSETITNLDEDAFNLLLPEKIMVKSKRFFTPAGIAIQAAKWLSGNDKRDILDIGAGVGKFCLFGAMNTESNFTGIEMRPHLVEIAEDMFRYFGVKKAKIIQGNITDFQFTEFNSFYLYNPFHENIVPYLRMDDSILLSEDFYCVYIQHTRSQLAMAQIGTKLVTYHGGNLEVPTSYKKVEEFFGGDLKFWIKER